MGKPQGHVTITEANSLCKITGNAGLFHAIFNPKFMEQGEIKIARKNVKSCISSQKGIILLKKNPKQFIYQICIR